jgi:hypothetical protein
MPEIIPRSTKGIHPMTNVSSIFVNSTVIRATIADLFRNAGNDPHIWSVTQRDDLETLCTMMNTDALTTDDHVRLAGLQRVYAPHSVN